MGDGECAHFLVRIRWHAANYDDPYNRLTLGVARAGLARYAEALNLLGRKALTDIADCRRSWLMSDRDDNGPGMSAAASMETTRCEFLGDLYTEKGNLRAAIRWYERALQWCDNVLRWNPARAERVTGNKTRLHFLLGASLWKLGSWHEALQHIRWVLNHCTDNEDIEEARSAMGLIYRTQGLYKQAAHYFKQIEATDELEDLRSARALPDNPARKQLIELDGPVSWSVGGPRYLRTHPEDWDIRFRLCYQCCLLKRFRRALVLITSAERRYGMRLLEVVDQLTGRSLMALISEQKGFIYESQGRYRVAAGWFQRAAVLEPENATHWASQGSCEARRGNLAEAERLFRQATHCSTGSLKKAWQGLGLVLRSQERFDEAAECFRLALQLDPDNEASQFALMDVQKAMAFLSSVV